MHLHCLLNPSKLALVVDVEGGVLDVVLLVDDVVPGPDGHQVGVVGGGGDGDRPGAPGVGVAQLVGQLLQLVSIEVVVIPEDVVVTRPACALNALVRTKVEVELRRVGDAHVDSGAGRDVAWLNEIEILVALRGR